MQYVRPLFLGLIALATFFLSPSTGGEALPSTLPLFSVRDLGTSAHDITPIAQVAGPPFLTCTAADLMTAPGTLGGPCAGRVAPAPAGPVPDGTTVAPIDLGLEIGPPPPPFIDELDGISFGEAVNTGFVDIDFSVDAHPGEGGTTTAFGASCGFLPDVTSEAAAPGGPEAQGDIFNTGTLAPPGCNSLAIDEGALGLIAPVSALIPAGPPPLDDIDALTEEIVGGGPCTLHGGTVPTATCPGFSVDPTSATLPFIAPGAASGGVADAASILVPPATPAIPPELPAPCAVYGTGIDPCIAVHSSTLGLTPGDDIDALCWWDANSNGVPDQPNYAFPGPGIGDFYAFSLSPTSAAVTGPPFFSAADLLIPTGGPPTVSISAAFLGLLGSDNVDGLICHDADADFDDIPDTFDNCPFTTNPGQSDVDGDGIGDACDSEGPSPNADGLGGLDDCIDGVDNDGDSLTDGLDPTCDGDGDLVPDVIDNCPFTPNPGQSDVDGDGIGDACDTEGPPGNGNGVGGIDDCTDTVDNDGDGFFDGLDPGCFVVQEAIFSVQFPDIAIPGCEQGALLTLPGIGAGGPCPPRGALPIPDLVTAPPTLGLDLVFGTGTDNLDALSLSEPLGLTPSIHFSVDPFSVGIPCAPPDVSSEFALGEAHGDIFTDLALSGCNFQFQDELVQGLNAPGAPFDDMDALAEPPAPAAPVPCAFLPLGGPCPVYSIDPFSGLIGSVDPFGSLILASDLLVPPGTPAAGIMPGPCPFGGLPCVAVPAVLLGLDIAGGLFSDDLDALCWFDLNLNGLPDLPVMAGGPDDYYYSLLPGSFSLFAFGFTAADVLAPIAGVPGLVAPGAALGLAPGDNLDAMKCLEVFAPVDADGDTIPDGSDNCPNWFNPGQLPPPWPVGAIDPDCDGFDTAAETFVGTLPLVQCASDTTVNNEAPDPWPTDFDDDTDTDIFDVLNMKPHFGSPSPNPNYSARHDLQGQDGDVDIFDVLAMKPFFSLSC